ncbi:TPA: SGNH/GDSL hydrolase family protein, partial [Escherichia coli]|nr:SGNH/GDSL hydrolase family protein [Escherichia coli]
MGDSYTVGIGATQASYNDFRVMCDALGLDGIADGISGSGWTSTQDGRVPPERIRLKLGNITRQPQYVFLSLGYNDAGTEAMDTLTENFTETVEEIRRLCPLAKIIVIGPATPLGATTA